MMASNVVDLFLNKEIVNAAKTCNKTSMLSAEDELIWRFGRGVYIIISFDGVLVEIFKSTITRICSSETSH